MPTIPIVARFCGFFVVLCPECGSVDRTENELEAYQLRNLHRCPPAAGIDGLLAAVERAIELSRL